MCLHRVENVRTRSIITISSKGFENFESSVSIVRFAKEGKGGFVVIRRVVVRVQVFESENFCDLLLLFPISFFIFFSSEKRGRVGYVHEARYGRQESPTTRLSIGCLFVS